MAFLQKPVRWLRGIVPLHFRALLALGLPVAAQLLLEVSAFESTGISCR